MSSFQIQSGQTIVYAGDSITDCGRRAESAPHGAGYVRQAIELITAKYAEREINHVNIGIGGNAVTDLEGRRDEDALRHRPDWLTVLFGINDQHRTLNGGEGAVPPERYETIYRGILQAATDCSDPSLVILDPFYIAKPEDADEQQKKVQSV